VSDQITRVSIRTTAACGKEYELNVVFSDYLTESQALATILRALNKIDLAAGKKRRE